jgi:tetratricopeptide (TPR) repeat protein
MKTYLKCLFGLVFLYPTPSFSTANSDFSTPVICNNASFHMLVASAEVRFSPAQDSGIGAYFVPMLAYFRQSCTREQQILLADVQRLKKRLEKPGADQAALSQQIAARQADYAALYKIADHYETYDGAIWKMAELLAENAPDGVYDETALELIRKGRIDEARAVLREPAKGDDCDTVAVLRTIQRYLLDANLAQLQLKWDEATRNYERAIAADSTEPFSHTVFATFLNYRGDHAGALRHNQIYLGLDISERNKAVCLNNLALSLYALNDLPAAEKALAESMRISERLAQQDTAKNLHDLARATSNSTILLREKGNMAAVEKILMKNLDINRQLYASDPQQYAPTLARTFDRLCALYFEVQNLEALEKACAEHLSLCRQLANDNPAAFEPDLAAALNRKAIVLRIKGEINASENVFFKSIALYRSLSAANPLLYERELASRLVDLSYLYLDKGELATQEKLLAEALALNTRLAEIAPAAGSPKTAFLTMMTAIVNMEAGKMVQAENLLEKAYTLACQSLESPVSQQVKTDVELQLARLAVAPLEKELETAEGTAGLIAVYRKMAAVWENEAKKYPDNTALQERITQTYIDISWYQLLEENFEEAELSARRGLESVPDEPALRCNLAHALLFQGKYAEAVAIYTALKDVEDGEGRPYGMVCTDELVTFRESGITHPDTKKIITLLGGE